MLPEHDAVMIIIAEVDASGVDNRLIAVERCRVDLGDEFPLFLVDVVDVDPRR